MSAGPGESAVVYGGSAGSTCGTAVFDPETGAPVRQNFVLLENAHLRVGGISFIRYR